MRNHSPSRFRTVENPRRKHRAEVGRADEPNIAALSGRGRSLLKRLYDRAGNSALNGPFTGQYPGGMNSRTIQRDRENSRREIRHKYNRLCLTESPVYAIYVPTRSSSIFLSLSIILFTLDRMIYYAVYHHILCFTFLSILRLRISTSIYITSILLNRWIFQNVGNLFSSCSGVFLFSYLFRRCLLPFLLCLQRIGR
jgi:hypothetical protein